MDARQPAMLPVLVVEGRHESLPAEGNRHRADTRRVQMSLLLLYELMVTARNKNNQQHFTLWSEGTNMIGLLDMLYSVIHHNKSEVADSFEVLFWIFCT